MATVRRAWPLILTLFIAGTHIGCADDQPSGTTPDPSLGTDAGPSTDAGPVADAVAAEENTAVLTPDTLIQRVASAVCTQLTSCCNSTDGEIYFTTLRNNMLIEEAGLADNFPPVVPTAEFDCEPALIEAMNVVPFGKWIQAVEDGFVEFDQAEAEQCLAELTESTCGESATAALFDSRCYGLNPPPSGLLGRRMFVRSSGVGDTCMPLADGVGAAIYGTCDPNVAWCCRENEAGKCGLSENTTGTCVAAGDEGEVCGLVPEMQFCRTGLDCGTTTCEKLSYESLNVGDTCYENFQLMGDCEDSFCDLFGTGRCEALKPNGDECVSPEECLAGGCTEGICSVPSFCSDPGAWGETKPEEPVVPNTDIDPSALEVARFLEGEFSSLAQSKTNPSYFDIHLVTCLVKAPSYGNLVLYVEQASGNNLSQPYRQRLYVVTGDGSTVRSEVWAPMNSQAWIGTCSKPGLTEVQIGDFALRSGCDVFLEPTATGFVGGTEGTECQSTLAGASYATSKVTLESDLLLSWDQGFSSNGAQVWGATAGAYRFDRLSPMTDAAQWLEAVEALQ